MVLWIPGTSNPADKLGKFDIDKDLVEKWIGLANQLLRPEVLQQHPKKFLNKLIHTSQGRIKTILQGGRSEDVHDQASPADVSVRHISCYEGYVPKYPVEQNGYNTDILQRIVDRNKA